MQRRLFRFIFVLASFITLTSVTTYFWPVQRLSLLPSAPNHYGQWTNSSEAHPTRACRLPRMSPWHWSLLSLIEHPREVTCRRVQPDFTYLDENGTLRLNGSAISEFELEEKSRRSVAKSPKVNCQYSYFDRGRVDREVVFDSELPLTKPVLLEKNFVRVLCNLTLESNSGVISSLVYANLYSHPIPVENANRSSLSEDGDDMNVLLLFVESASASMVRRHLPATFDYLTNTMKVFVFDSMLKVGENTLPNLAALFTGLRLRNEQSNMQPQLKQASTNGGFYDHWPFIWRRFADEAGYATAYLEDCTRLGTFHYSGDGFRKKPVDYWYYPFLETMRLTKLPRKSSKFCFANRPTHEIFIDILTRHLMSNDWIRRRQFFFSIFSELSHDYAFDLERADDSLKDFLRSAHENGRLNRTLLVFAGDHGPRFTSIRSTVAGFVEERVPFFSLWLPPWFLQQYPEVEANLNSNRNRLTSLFDVHETLIDVLERRFSASDHTYRPSPRGALSLFRPLPLNRSCSEAGIPDRYCLCDGIEIASIDHPLANRSALLILSAVRNITKKYRTKCAKLKIEKILYFIRIGEKDRYPDQTANAVKSYFTAFRTVPLGAVFEGAVLYNETDSTLHFQQGTLERINSFGGKGRCVPTIQLKKFCACKEDVYQARTVKR